jgi:hypothetical protein
MVSDEARELYLSLNILPPKYADAIRNGEWDGTTAMKELATFEAKIRADQHAKTKAAILEVRHANATNFKPTDDAWGAYDQAVLDCYAKIEAMEMNNDTASHEG